VDQVDSLQMNVSSRTYSVKTLSYFFDIDWREPNLRAMSKNSTGTEAVIKYKKFSGGKGWRFKGQANKNATADSVCFTD
jgi:hypothetical protein